MKPEPLLIIALVAGSFGAAGCGGRSADVVEYKDTIAPPGEPLIRQVATVGRYGGRFVLGQRVNPKTFNAMMATETSSSDITNLTFASLVSFDNGTQAFGPELAKSWEVAPDNVTWTFHLRKGAAFSDGHPMTAEDVLFSFEVAYDPVLHPSIQDLLKVGGQNFKVSSPDPYTVVIDTIRPNSALLDVLCVGGLPIVPKHVFEAALKDGTFASAYNVGTPPEQLVSGGPWRVAQYVPGEKTVLGRNPYYFGFDQRNQRLPYLNELVFLIVPDQDSADLKFRSGELDGLDNVKPENYKWYEDHQKDGNFTLYDLGPANNQYFFWFNLNRVQPPLPGEKPAPGKKTGEPFVDPVKYAWFNSVVFRRAVSMAVDRDAMIPSIFFGQAEKNWSLDTPANKEWYIPDLPRADFQYDVMLLGLQGSVPPTPGNGQNVWRSSGETHEWFIRQQKSATPEEARIDQLMDEILTNLDVQAQKKAWREMQTIINEQGWMVWLPVLKVKLPMSNRFGNTQPSIMAHRLLWNIERVYVKPRES